MCPICQETDTWGCWKCGDGGHTIKKELEPKLAFDSPRRERVELNEYYEDAKKQLKHMVSASVTDEEIASLLQNIIAASAVVAGRAAAEIELFKEEQRNRV